MMRLKQRYISGELTHFVGRKRKRSVSEQYNILKKILKEGTLSPSKTPPGIIIKSFDSSKRISDNETVESSSVSFSDIPVGDLDIHIKKYGKCGLSFKRNFIAEQGGRPMQYIPLFGSNNKGKLNKEYFNELFQDYGKIMALFLRKKKRVKEMQYIPTYFEWGDFLWDLPCYLKFYNHNLDDSHEDNYYFEREWRVIGHVKFNIKNVERIFIPKKYAIRFRKDFPEFYGQITFT